MPQGILSVVVAFMGGAGVVGFLGALAIFFMIIVFLHKSNNSPNTPPPFTEPPGHVSPIEPTPPTNSDPNEVHFAPTTKYSPPKIVPGKDHKYTLGAGKGRVEISVYGRSFPEDEKRYWGVKGPWLVRKFKEVSSFGAPEGFYFFVHLYIDKDQFYEVIPKAEESNWAGVFCPAYNSIICDIHTTDNKDTMTHEMVHALQHAAYGSLPLCLTEGMADWIADSYTHSTRNIRQFYHSANVRVLAKQIKGKGFPDMEAYLGCVEYADWEKLLGRTWNGYCIGAMLCDYLFTHHQVWIGRALQYCHQKGDNTKERSKAFADFVKNNWEGGYKDLDAKLQNWILHCAKTYK